MVDDRGERDEALPSVDHFPCVDIGIEEDDSIVGNVGGFRAAVGEQFESGLDPNVDIP